MFRILDYCDRKYVRQKWIQNEGEILKIYLTLIKKPNILKFGNTIHNVSQT
jgi:hypothetical protein